jgi:hypothetical protein
VPVEVVGDEASHDAAQIEHILSQHAENAHRAALRASPLSTGHSGPMTPKTLTSSPGVAQASSRLSPTHVPGHAAYIEVFWEVDEDAEDPEDDEQRVAEATYVCLDPLQYGHLEPPQESSRAQQAADVDEDAPQEAAKAERRRVLANNKAWRTAETDAVNGSRTSPLARLRQRALRGTSSPS